MSGDSQNSEQAKRFKEAARELGCDDSEEAFDEALKKVAKAKPKKDEPKPRSPKGKRGATG